MAKTGEVREALEVMETRWPGYLNAKTIIRDHIATLSAEVERLQARLGEAEALAVKWRDEAMNCGGLPFLDGKSFALDICADELDAITGRKE